MAITVTLPTGDVTDNLIQFSVQEDATPMDVSSGSGGVGSLSASLLDFPGSQRLHGRTVLASGSQGKFSGDVSSLSSANGVLSIAADSVLGAFNTDRAAEPFSGTLGDAVQNYCDLVGITNDVTVDSSVSARSVVIPGWKGNAWVYLKQFLSAQEVEIALVFDRVYVRPFRTITATLDRELSRGWSLDDTGAAKTVEITYYNTTYGTQVEVYPLVDEDPQILVVDSGETHVVEQKIGGSLSSVNQPVLVEFVDDESYSGTDGRYCVCGNDGLPITAAQWTQEGGSLSVALTDDPSVLEITIVGATNITLAPFRIAMTAGSSNYYNSLHITGTGVTETPEILALTTGNPSTSTQLGTTVENHFVRTREDAFNLGMQVAKTYAGINYVLNGSAQALNRGGQGLELIGATFDDFNNSVPSGYTVADFNADWPGKTIAEFNAYWAAFADTKWSNQEFGNAVGARIRGPEAFFRVTSTTITRDATQYTAVSDTMISDFNDLNPGMTCDEFNIRFAGMTCTDFSLSPLKEA